MAEEKVFCEICKQEILDKELQVWLQTKAKEFDDWTFVEATGDMIPKYDPPPCTQCGKRTEWEQVLFHVNPLKSYPTHKIPVPRCKSCSHLDADYWETKRLQRIKEDG